MLAPTSCVWEKKTYWMMCVMEFAPATVAGIHVGSAGHLMQLITARAGLVLNIGFILPARHDALILTAALPLVKIQHLQANYTSMLVCPKQVLQIWS